MNVRRLCLIVGITLSTAGPVMAQAGGSAGGGGGAGLAQEAANPISSVISMPFELDWDRRIGPNRDGHRFTVNFEPIVPIKLSPDWTVLSRTILPYVRQHDIAPGSGRQSGLGDTLQSFFLSPANAKEFIWGVGPVFGLPTGKNELLTSDKWTAGPTAVALVQSKSGLTYGALVNQVWSFAGRDGAPRVNRTFIEPFINQANKSGFSYGMLAEATKDWTAHTWSVPVSLRTAQLVKLGDQAVNIGVALRYYAAHNEFGPHGVSYQLNLNFQFPQTRNEDRAAFDLISAVALSGRLM